MHDLKQLLCMLPCIGIRGTDRCRKEVVVDSEIWFIVRGFNSTNTNFNNETLFLELK